MKWLIVLVVLAAGCGRRRFEELPDGAPGTLGDALADDAGDAPCAYTFCDNFNRSGPPNEGWDVMGLAGTGQATLVNGQFVATLSATSDSVYLVRQVPAPTTSVVIGMKIGYAATDVGTNCEIDLARLSWNMGTCMPFGFYLVRDGTGPFNLQETNRNAGCTGNRNNYYGNNDSTGLHDVKLTVTLGAANVATAVMEIDGVPRAPITMVQAVIVSTLRFEIGAVAVRNLASPWTITYEDVYIDVQ